MKFAINHNWDCLVLGLGPGDGSVPEFEFDQAELADLQRVNAEFNIWQRRLATLDNQVFTSPDKAGVKLVDLE